MSLMADFSKKAKMGDDLTFPDARYKVVVLKEGYFYGKDDYLCGSSSIVLLNGPKKVLVGTGLPSDKTTILDELKKHKIQPQDIQYVICPDPHIENIGNLNLFSSGIHIVGSEIMHKDKYIHHAFSMEIPYEINDSIQVISTPGHNHQGCTVFVDNTPLGCVAITGGVFHSEKDLHDPDLWVQQSYDPDLQSQSRIMVLQRASYIVPRYGPIFQVPDEFKRSEMQVVITP